MKYGDKRLLDALEHRDELNKTSYGPHNCFVRCTVLETLDIDSKIKYLVDIALRNYSIKPSRASSWAHDLATEAITYRAYQNKDMGNMEPERAIDFIKMYNEILEIVLKYSLKANEQYEEIKGD